MKNLKQKSLIFSALLFASTRPLAQRVYAQSAAAPEGETSLEQASAGMQRLLQERREQVAQIAKSRAKLIKTLSDDINTIYDRTVGLSKTCSNDIDGLKLIYGMLSASWYSQVPSYLDAVTNAQTGSLTIAKNALANNDGLRFNIVISPAEPNRSEVTLLDVLANATKTLTTCKEQMQTTDYAKMEPAMRATRDKVFKELTAIIAGIDGIIETISSVR